MQWKIQEFICKMCIKVLKNENLMKLVKKISQNCSKRNNCGFNWADMEEFSSIWKTYDQS